MSNLIKYRDISVGQHFFLYTSINEEYIKTDIRQYDGGDPSVAVSLKTGESISFDGDKPVLIIK